MRTRDRNRRITIKSYENVVDDFSASNANVVTPTAANLTTTHLLDSSNVINYVSATITPSTEDESKAFFKGIKNDSLEDVAAVPLDWKAPSTAKHQFEPHPLYMLLSKNYDPKTDAMKGWLNKKHFSTGIPKDKEGSRPFCEFILHSILAGLNPKTGKQSSKMLAYACGITERSLTRKSATYVDTKVENLLPRACLEPNKLV
jgi:hypothetical protein